MLEQPYKPTVEAVNLKETVAKAAAVV